MSRPASLMLLLVAGVLLGPAAASAELRADLNGDGISDRVDTGDRPTELTVHISNSRRVQRLHSDDAIVDLALADIDGDGDADLVATTSRHGLHIWIDRGHGRFLQRPTVSRRDGWRSGLTALRHRAPRIDSSDEWTDSAKPLIQSTPHGGISWLTTARAVPQIDRPRDRLPVDRRVPRGPPRPPSC